MSRNDPAFLFELRIPGRSGMAKHPADPMIVIRAFMRAHEPATGRTPMTLEVRQGGEVIFERRGPLCGSVNAYTSLDGVEAKELALSIVAMAPHDGSGVGLDYFHDYTLEQATWANEHYEYLTMVREDRYCDPETGECRRA